MKRGLTLGWYVAIALGTVFILAVALIPAIKRYMGADAPSRLTFLISGKTMGFLENCGCSGGQSGGMHRRATMIRSKRKELAKPIVSDDGRASEVVTLDVGDFSDWSDERQKLRSQGIVEAMGMIGYDAAGLGQNELGFEQKELLELLGKAPQLPWLCANLTFVKPEKGEDHSAELDKLVEPYRIVKLKSGYKVGVIHVLDNSSILRGEPIKSGYKVDDPTQTVNAMLKQHYSEAPFWVLSVGSNEQFGLSNQKLAGYDQLKLVFGMRGIQPKGGTNGVQFPYFVDRPMEKGKDVTICGVTFAEKNQLRITALKVGIREDTFHKADDVVKMIEEMRPQFRDFDEEEAKTIPTKGPNYYGFTSCTTCHRDIALALQETKHMHAYATLKSQGREHDGFCAKCHNNGFNKPGGFNIIKDAEFKDSEWPQRNVQCETCHGPGEYHVKLKMKQLDPKDPKIVAEGRDKQGLIPFDRTKTCQQCHDQENSPNFNFDKYWPHIQHGKGLTPKPGSPPGAGMGPGMGAPAHAEGASAQSASPHRDRVIAQLHALL